MPICQRTPFFSAPPPLPKDHGVIPNSGLTNRLNASFIPSVLHVSIKLDFRRKTPNAALPQEETRHHFPFNLKSDFKAWFEVTKELLRKPHTPQPQIKKLEEKKPLVSTETKLKMKSKVVNAKTSAKITLKVKKHQIKVSAKKMAAKLFGHKVSQPQNLVAQNEDAADYDDATISTSITSVIFYPAIPSTIVVTSDADLSTTATLVEDVSKNVDDSMDYDNTQYCIDVSFSDFSNSSFDLHRLIRNQDNYTPIERYELASNFNVDLDDLDRERFSFEYTMRSSSSYYSSDDSVAAETDSSGETVIHVGTSTGDNHVDYGDNETLASSPRISTSPVSSSLPPAPTDAFVKEKPQPTRRIRSIVPKEDRFIKPDDTYRYHKLKRIEEEKVVLEDFTIDKDELWAISTEELERMVDAQVVQIMEMMNPAILQVFGDLNRSRYLYANDASINTVKSFRQFLYDRIDFLKYDYNTVVEFYRMSDFIEEASEFVSDQRELNNRAAIKLFDVLAVSEDGATSQSIEDDTSDDSVAAVGHKVELEDAVDDWVQFMNEKVLSYGGQSFDNNSCNQLLLLTWTDRSSGLNGPIETLNTAQTATAATVFSSHSAETLETEESNDDAGFQEEQQALKKITKVTPLIQMFESFGNVAPRRKVVKTVSPKIGVLVEAVDTVKEAQEVQEVKVAANDKDVVSPIVSSSSDPSSSAESIFDEQDEFLHETIRRFPYINKKLVKDAFYFENRQGKSYKFSLVPLDEDIEVDGQSKQHQSCDNEKRKETENQKPTPNSSILKRFIPFTL